MQKTTYENENERSVEIQTMEVIDKNLLSGTISLCIFYARTQNKALIR